MANHVLVDFYLANVTLAEGKEHVNVAVTGPGIEKELTGKVEKFGTPLYLDNLQNGSYSVKLDLVGADNKPLAGAVWGSVTREFKVDRDAPNDAPHAAHDATPPAATDAAKPAASAAPKPAASAPKGASAAPPPKPAASAAPKK